MPETENAEYAVPPLGTALWLEAVYMWDGLTTYCFLWQSPQSGRWCRFSLTGVQGTPLPRGRNADITRAP